MASEAKMENDVDRIIRWESGDMDESEAIEFFQDLVNSGLVWRLQGCYGRTAVAMMQAGLIKSPRMAS